MNTVGYTLKSSRISQQLTLDYVSSELKISKSTLQELENDEIKLNADIVFIIGHLRTYSNFLNLETNKLINQFKSEISYNQNNYSDEIVKPSIKHNYFNINKIVSSSLILIVFFSFYFLFINNSNNEPEYASIPDLPESLVPIIEKQSLDIIENNNVISNEKFISQDVMNNSSAVASSNVNEKIDQNTSVTLKILNPTWLQLRDSSDNIILSKLMEKNAEYTYDLNLNYTITSGNGGNILVLIDNSVRGKIAGHGEVIDSIIIDQDFQN